MRYMIIYMIHSKIIKIGKNDKSLNVSSYLYDEVMMNNFLNQSGRF